MYRRSFIKNTFAAGALLSINSCDTTEKKAPEDSADFPLQEISVRELLTAYESGAMTCEYVTRLYLDRIAAIDKSGPSINSIITTNPDAITSAIELDKLRKSGNIKGGLHGIPILLKDNIDTSGSMKTTAGSLALKDNQALQNAFITQKLIDAGALILGKTNLSEWANFRSNRSSSGWSAVGGQTHNPYVLDRSPCGSSSGSGAAIAANLCTAAIGTETDGSIICPSSINGIVGIKPTIGLVSRSGIVPIAHSHDTAGPMTRTVEDAAILLGVMVGADENDPYTKRGVGKGYADYTQFLNMDGLNGKRIGVARRFFGFHEEVDAIMENAINEIRSLGATIVEMPNEELSDLAEQDAFNVLLYEFKHDLNIYLRNCPEQIQVRSLSDLIEFNKENKDLEMPFFQQEVFLEAEKKGELTDEQYLTALNKVLKANGENGIDKSLQTYELDAIMAPSNGPAWQIDLINGDHFLGGSSSPAARSGYASITVPAGFVQGLPIGISFFAGAFSEPTLISIAYAYEQATKHRQPPQFLPMINNF